MNLSYRNFRFYIKIYETTFVKNYSCHLTKMSSWFKDVQQAPPFEVFAMKKLFEEDSMPKKVDLCVGIYRSEEGKPWMPPVIHKVELKLANETQNHDYLPMLGMDSFITAAIALLLGKDNPLIKDGKAFGVQTLSGTGALRMGADFLCQVLKLKTFYYSSPSWDSHPNLFLGSGFANACQYRYWDPVAKGIDFEGMKEDLTNAPEESVVIFHACAHNPTGSDPTQDQWKEIAKIVKEKRLFPFFDIAYQGFASGNLEKDAWAIRYFAEQGFELLVAQSFAKNFGLYNERAGNLMFVVNDKAVEQNCKSQLENFIRCVYSSPPNHGARIVSIVLNDPALRTEWMNSVKAMSNRIIEMRKGLKERLLKLGTPNNNKWNHLTEQTGMFSYIGITENQVEMLRQKYHVYLLKSGRVNVCGLTTKNLDYVAQAIHETLLALPADK